MSRRTGPYGAAGQRLARPAPGQSAIVWQRELYDALMEEDPDAAFGGEGSQEPLWEKRAELAARYIHRGDRVLELGCGSGIVTQRIAEASGSRVLGIDVSDACVTYARAHSTNPRVEYRRCAAEEFEPTEPFSLVTMYEVIEHVDDPQVLLRRIHGWLRPRGHLILSTPNASSLQRRIRRLPGLRRAYRRLTGRDPHDIANGHVAEYTLRQLVAMLDGTGFEVVARDGAGLAVPFPHAIPAIARSEAVARFNIASGRYAPRLAEDVYLVAQRSVP